MKNGLTVREEASVTSSVMYGVATWLAYAAVEFVLFSVVPVVTRLGLVLNAPLWHATGMLFATYALIGGVLGAISGGLLLRLCQAESAHDASAFTGRHATASRRLRREFAESLAPSRRRSDYCLGWNRTDRRDRHRVAPHGLG
jgi:hypothetical protein